MKKSLLCCLFLLVANLMMADGVVVVDGMKFVIDTETNQVSLTSVEIGVDSLFIPEKIMFEGKEYAVTTLVNHDWSGVRFVEVPSSLKSLPKGCFSYEEDLVGVKFSSSLASLGSCCFEMCRNLRDVELPSSLTTLNDRCFNGCSSLESLDIPASVTSLGNMCFCDCSSLKSVILPSTVTSLGYACFLRCSNISEITIPASVTTLGNDCFGSCSKLQRVEIPSSVTSLGRSCFWCCSSLTEVVIPSSVTSLEDQTFYDCSNLTDVEIPSSVTSLGSSCFQGCIRLRSLVIPSSVTSLGSDCFLCCQSLESIKIPLGVEAIESGTFSSCNNLVSVDIPSSVKKIKHFDFNGCTSLLTLNVFAKEPPVFESSTMDSLRIPDFCKVYVPEDSFEKYKNAKVWRKCKLRVLGKTESVEKPKQCEAPQIMFDDGKLKFLSVTPNTEYHYSINAADATAERLSNSGEVDMLARYQIEVYATADGYKPSEKTTGTLVWLDKNVEGSNVIKVLDKRGIVVTVKDGQVSISGLNDGEDVMFYNADGLQIGVQKATGGVVRQSVSDLSNTMVIARIGEQSVKIMIR